jgi:hypothetical protein
MLLISALEKIFGQSDYRDRYMYSKATRTCIRCGKFALKFRNASARLEYSISALCQKCQDEIFNRNEPIH